MLSWRKMPFSTLNPDIFLYFSFSLTFSSFKIFYQDKFNTFTLFWSMFGLMPFLIIQFLKTISLALIINLSIFNEKISIASSSSPIQDFVRYPGLVSFKFLCHSDYHSKISAIRQNQIPNPKKFLVPHHITSKFT